MKSVATTHQFSSTALTFLKAIALALIATNLAAAADDLPLLEEQAIKAAAARVAPAVVRIETIGGIERVGELQIGAGPTSGLIVSADGYIVASAFNFSQKPESILVTIPGQKRVGATFVATDTSRQLVLLKIEPPAPLIVPEAVPANEVRVGQWAIALGRGYDEDVPNISVGVISATDRIWSKAIQTDAKISPNNYGGPLVDISGRVFGILAPLVPEIMANAGIELYDSGIGFAVPLTQIQTNLDRWTKGDLAPGVLGISLKGNDQFSKPAVIAASRVGSPAFKAGLRSGDEIIEANGQPVTRQTQFKHQLGPLYAGDKIQIVALRGNKKERIAVEAQLVDKLPVYEFPFVGILPMRPVAGEPKGLFVRYVFPDSPAIAAGIEPGDQIVACGGVEIASAAKFAEKLHDFSPEDRLPITIRRGTEKLDRTLDIGRFAANVPGELPAPFTAERPAATEGPKRGIVPIKLAEFANECVAYVPESYRPEIPHGVVMVLHAPGHWKQDDFVARWKPLCEQYDLIAVAPRSTDPNEWATADAKFVRRALDEVMKSYEIDSARVVVHGHEGGGALAYVVAFGGLDVVRGLAVVDAPLPQAVKPPETNPTQRLAIYSAQSNRGKFAGQVKTGLKRLSELKYPLVTQSTGNEPRYLNAEELAALARWIDSLDRL